MPSKSKWRIKLMRRDFIKIKIPRGVYAAVLATFLLVLLTGTICNAQQVAATQTPCTATGQATVGNFTISYTIGEMPLVQSWQSNGLMITQGVLQPVPFIADTVYECYGQSEVKVYPSPTSGLFSLRLSLLKKGTVKIVLYDVTGRMIQLNEFDYNTFSTTQFDIAHLRSGLYYLQLFFTEAGSTRPKKCVYTIEKLN